MSAQQGYTYSFQDVQANLRGPGGNINLGDGSGAAEEGIRVEFVKETDAMLIGADGSGSHSLIASQAAKLTVRILKTSPTHRALMTLYNFQRQSSLNFGRNTLVISNPVVGDMYTATQVAFAKNPPNDYGTEAKMLDWEFNAVICIAHLGDAGLLTVVTF